MDSSFIVSDITDNNIFHIFAFDIIKYYNPKCAKAFIISNNIDKTTNCQKWRYFVMKKLYNCCYIKTKELTFIKNKYHEGYNCHKFINYKPDSHIKNIYNKIMSNAVYTNKKYILLNVRNDQRILYENKTGLKLEDFLEKQKDKLMNPFLYCNFAEMTPKQQYKMCNNASLFISAHGAGCTNLIFTPQTTPLIEINFRKHWYCDPVCDKHFHGKISMNKKCDGKLTYKPEFHKADYHNLCHLLGKKYIEIEAIKYDGGFVTINPISKKYIYIDGDHLIKKINKLLN